MSQLVVGTAGHIDHGKTSLVKALTGVNTDNLVQEKERGMTIDLGFAYLNESITIIDVPGHEKFIRNMTAGAANIHYGLIVVAADDGIMPQTIEHLDILTILGVNKGWVAITKVDIVKDLEWIDLVELDIRDLLMDRGFEFLSMHRINNLNGDGIESLKSKIVNIVFDAKPQREPKRFRMNVDRVFSKTGFGTVVTGTVVNGFAQTGDEIEILPSTNKARIRGIQSHGGVTQEVSYGDRAAINLSNIKLSSIQRGNTICTPGLIKPTKLIIANVLMTSSTKWKIINNQRLRFHFGTSEVLGRISMYGISVLEKGQIANVFIKLESYLSVALEDRFVIRSYSPMNTIGGGIVLDANSDYPWEKLKKILKKMPINKEARFKFLVDLNWRKPKSIDFWEGKFFNTNFDIDKFAQKDLMKSDSGLLFSNNCKNMATDYILKYFSDSYAINPYRKVLTFESINNKLKISDEWSAYLIMDLIKKNIIQDYKGGYALKDFTNKLSEKDIEEITKIENFIKRSGFKPLLLIEIIESLKIQQKRLGNLLHILIEENKVTAIGNNLYIHSEKLDKLHSELLKYFSKNKQLKVGDFKNLTSLTRRTAIPLLEYLDKNNFTNRVDNIRYQGEMLNE